MELLKTRTLFRFSEAFNPWREMRSLIRTAGDNASAEIEGPPLILDLKELKQRILLHVKAFEFLQEGIDSNETSISVALEKVIKLDISSKLPQIELLSHEAIFIEPYAMPFHELLRLIKTKFLRPGTLVDSITDTGLMFDIVEGNILKHFQFGPMEKEQLLKMYLQYGKDKVPDTFIFLNLQYQRNLVFNFKTEEIRQFFQAAAKWQSDQAKYIFSYIKEEVG